MLLSNKLKYLLLILLIDFGFYESKGQNLITNGSFENYTAPVNCSGGSGGFDNYSVFPVNHVLDNWYGYYTPDFFTSLCSGINSNGNPVNLFGYSYPKNGNNYVGIGLYQAGSNDVKEYIYQQLNSPLVANKVYCLSFFVKRSQRSTYATKNIEVYFSNNSVNTGTLGYINAIPQIAKQNIFISDTVNWIEIQGCFTANGGEQFMTIGNFNNNANTDTLFIGTNNPIPSYGDFSHYYIDDITLYDQSTVGIQDVSYWNEVVGVSPNPANDIINFQFSNALEKRKVELHDAIGNLVLERNASSNNLSLTTDNLPNGIYFYSILVGEKTIKTDKFVIIK